MSEVLSRYTFLPWARKGMSIKIEEEENFNDFTSPPSSGWALDRPNIRVRVNIDAQKGTQSIQDSVDQNVALVGPGDIIGVDDRIVVKTEPKNWVTNFEPNYFPYIEFYDEDFSWRYSPASPVGHKLRPWITLIALKEEEFSKDKNLFGTLPSILIKGSDTDTDGTSGASSNVFPDAGQIWAWSHVHLNGDVDSTNNLNPDVSNDLNTALDRFRDLLDANPNQAAARMICPRILEPNTTYHCFLIPSFETGRLAGLGADPTVISTVRAQASSFGQDHSSAPEVALYVDHFPYYYTWQFMTGDVGDFESLVRKLEAIEVDPAVGKRSMDIQEPGYNVSFDVTDASQLPDNGAVQLEGAMLPPFGTTTRAPYPTHTSTPHYTYRKRLADLINLGEDLMQATFPADQFYGKNPFGYTGTEEDIEDDPIITPDLYGRWHALQNTLDTSRGTSGAINNDQNWPYELNLDPRSRAVAGLGVQHIKNHQEKLMDRAWAQMGEIIEANRKLKWGQLSQKITLASYNKNIINLNPDSANAVVGSLFKKVKLSGITAFQEVKLSALPTATQTASFRKLERPRGPLMRRLNTNNSISNPTDLRVSLGNRTALAAAPKKIGAQISAVTIADINKDVAAIASHTISSAIYAPAPVEAEGSTLSKELEIESEYRFQAAVLQYDQYFDTSNWVDKPEPPKIDLGSITNQVLQKVNPNIVIPRFVYNGLRILGTAYTPPPPNKIVPIMAYPVFGDPLYEAVKDQGTDYLIPNLHLIPNNSITLLETNQRFIEAFMVGVNHEMGRELLWREFPTDQRGSYFRQFWNSNDQINTLATDDVQRAKEALDIEEIHLWPTNTHLGTHSARPGAPDSGLLVLVIRGDLLKKYPDTIIYAQQAKFKGGNSNNARELDVQKEYPVFTANIEPDITFFGFKLVASQVEGNRDDNDAGWFFILQERPGEIRFGLDNGGSSTRPASWQDLSQGNAAIMGNYLDASDDAVTTSPTSGNRINNKSVRWGFNSTNFAQILYQDPVRLAVHGSDMIP